MPPLPASPRPPTSLLRAGGEGRHSCTHFGATEIWWCGQCPQATSSIVAAPPNSRLQGLLSYSPPCAPPLLLFPCRSSPYSSSHSERYSGAPYKNRTPKMPQPNSQALIPGFMSKTQTQNLALETGQAGREWHCSAPAGCGAAVQVRWWLSFASQLRSLFVWFARWSS